MKTKNQLTKLMLLISLALPTAMFAQSTEDPGITVYQYYRVAPDKRAEFVKRETTYWAEVVRKALAGGNITFWALLEKVGGYDLENSSNFLIVNSYKNIDAAGEVWSTKNITAAVPNVTMDKMSTDGMSTVTSRFFLRDEDWQQAAGAVPDKDFNYITIVYHDTSNPGNLIALEKKHWAPFIKGAMDKKQTTQVAWGNAVVLSPSGHNIHFTTVSYDLYSTLKEALNPTWDPKVVIPEGMTEIGKVENGRGSAVYQIIKVVSPN